MLITTLPSPEKVGLVEKMFSHPAIYGARHNVGLRTLYEPKKALSILKDVADKYGKKLWVDLKGRQLRIKNWANPSYGDIELNHEIEVDLPAKIIFRGDDKSNVIAFRNNKILIDPDPKYALGAGQAVNIIGSNLKIKGNYLTDRDIEYIEAAKELGINDFMLSFVEEENDITQVKNLHPDANCILKIESLKGLEYVANHYDGKYQLMAARDDLMINIGRNKSVMLDALELIVQKDPKAIVASHIFTSLDTQGFVSMADISDLRLLELMGYNNFMLSDGVAHKCFDKAIIEWVNYWK